MLVYASGQCMEQRSCGCSQLWHSAPPGMAVGCGELRLRSTPWYRLVCICFPTPGRGLPYGSGLGLSRCLGPGECLHSFTSGKAHLGLGSQPQEHHLHHSVSGHATSTRSWDGQLWPAAASTWSLPRVFDTRIATMVIWLPVTRLRMPSGDK